MLDKDYIAHRVLNLIAPIILFIGFSLNCPAETPQTPPTWKSIDTNDTLLLAILSLPKDTIKITDPFEVRVELLNAGKWELLILSRLWLGSPPNNASLYATDESGKSIKMVPGRKPDKQGFFNDTAISFSPPDPPATLLLYPGEFWGATEPFYGNDFPKPGIYYLQMTYAGCSSDFIKALIKGEEFLRSDLHSPIDKFWHGEIKSNKIKIVVEK